MTDRRRKAESRGRGSKGLKDVGSGRNRGGGEGKRITQKNPTYFTIEKG